MVDALVIHLWLETIIAGLTLSSGWLITVRAVAFEDVESWSPIFGVSLMAAGIASGAHAIKPMLVDPLMLPRVMPWGFALPDLLIGMGLLGIGLNGRLRGVHVSFLITFVSIFTAAILGILGVLHGQLPHYYRGGVGVATEATLAALLGGGMMVSRRSHKSYRLLPLAILLCSHAAMAFSRGPVSPAFWVSHVLRAVAMATLFVSVERYGHELSRKRFALPRGAE